MFLKICGTTNVEDALLAEQMGVDALGFVFAPSTRQVTVEQVAAIAGQLGRDVERIGVFSGFAGEAVVRAVQGAGLTGIQLHGSHSAALVELLRDRLGAGIRIVQTNHWRVGGQVVGAFASELRGLSGEAAIDAVLVDSRTMVADGGTGVAFDWKAAREAVRELGSKPLIVAGGLNADNVGEAIATLQPWGVDVVTGVEARPGKKDRERLAAFVQRVRAAG